MPRSNCKVLDNGDRFPEMACEAVDGGRIILPDDFDERWNVLLFLSRSLVNLLQTAVAGLPKKYQGLREAKHPGYRRFGRHVG